MPRRRSIPPTPYDLATRIAHGDPEDPTDLGAHLFIEVDATYSYPEDGPHGLTDTIRGYRWAASMFARLGMQLTEDVAAVRKSHGWCNGPVHCGVDLHDFDPASVLVWGPTLTITLPADWHPDLIQEWLDRVNRILGEIIVADQWQPTDENEGAAWP